MNVLRFILPLFAATLPPLALANGPALDARAITAAESLRDQAMQGSSAYDIVESLTTEIGPRMGDSPEYDRATAWAQAKFKTLGSLTRNGQVRYELKTPWRNGTTHVIFEPLEFIFWVGFPGDQAQSQSARSHHPNEWGGVLRQRTARGRLPPNAVLKFEVI